MNSTNPLDELLTPDSSAVDVDGLDLQISLDSSSVDSVVAAPVNHRESAISAISESIDLDGMELDLDRDPTKPLECFANPITGEIVVAADVKLVVRHIIELKSLKQQIETFERELRKSAMHLAKGETKTRRLTAEIDGELRTIIVEMPDDDWPERDLSLLYSWCNADARKADLSQFAERFIRAKPVTEYSPIKKEVKKLLNETFPDGSLQQQAKEKLLKCNRGVAGKLPAVKIEGESLPKWQRGKFGDQESEE